MGGYYDPPLSAECQIAIFGLVLPVHNAKNSELHLGYIFATFFDFCAVLTSILCKNGI